MRARWRALPAKQVAGKRGRYSASVQRGDDARGRYNCHYDAEGMEAAHQTRLAARRCAQRLARELNVADGL